MNGADENRKDIEIERLILKHALKNAYDYGEARTKAIIGKVVAENPELKKDMKTLMKLIEQTVNRVNSMSREEIESAMERFEYVEKTEKPVEERIRESVPNATEGKVVTRIPPEPNAAALHIGHAKAMWLDRLVADLFRGRCILRWDDTNPESERSEYVSAIKEDLKSLGITWDDEVYTSDYIELMYRLCEKLIRNGHGYVCTCPPDRIHENRKKGIECSCRSRPVEENLRLWNDMLEGRIGPGKAIVRMKGDMKSKNTAMRDPTLFRIIDTEKTPHFRHGRKYRVWPTYDFSSAVMDSPDTLGITHPIRSKEYELRNEPYFKLMELLGLSRPTLITISRLEIPGYPVSKRLIKPLVEEGKVWGWDDPRLLTIKGLLRRGIQPEAIKRFVLRFGISTVESRPDLSLLFAENRKLVDSVAPRRFFVNEPVMLVVEDAEPQTISLPNHPTNGSLGVRELTVGNRFYIPNERLGPGTTVRLKGLFNVKIVEMDEEKKEVKGTVAGKEPVKGVRILQWVSVEDALPCKVYIPGKLFDDKGRFVEDSMKEDEGYTESATADALDRVVQFERYGFVRIDKVENGRVTAVFTHE